MKAKDISGQVPGGKRTKLADVVPLDTPFVVQIFPVYACTFKCNYCIFSIKKSKRGFISDQVLMDPVTYNKCIDDMAKFPNKIKTLRFVGIGEPLLHPFLSDMIKYASDKKVANVIEIITNASLLTSTKWCSLVNAGLNRLVVSIQGTSAKKYKKVCGVDINFDRFVQNLRYAYEHKDNVQIYIKIIDCALDGKGDEKKFFDIFGDICDTIAVEHTVPIHSGIDYKDVIKEGNGAVTQLGQKVSDIKVCPQPFFTMQINPDGKVVPCYSFEYPSIMGDCNTQSITDIWNGEVFRDFRKEMLDGRDALTYECKNCNIMQYRISPEDVLDNDIDKIKKTLT